MTDQPGGGDSRNSARLADQERLQAEREHKLLEREEAVLRRERAYIGRQLALADRETSILTREEALHRRAMKLGRHAEVVARLTSPGKQQRTFDPSRLSYETLEVAPDRRAMAVAKREEALIARLDAVTERFRTLEQQEGLQAYHEDLLQLRDHEVSRMSQRLDDLERIVASGGSLRSRSGIPATLPESEQDAKIDRYLEQKGPIPKAVEPQLARDPAPALVAPRQPRIGLKVYIGLESEHNFYTGFTQNISNGGLFIATHNMLDVGRQVELLFHLPDGRAIHTQGEVAWIREYNEQTPDIAPGMGIRFLDVSPEDASRIREFISARDPIYYDGP